MTQTTESLNKQRFTAQLPQELIAKARNAVYWTPGLTLTQIALENFINQLEVERDQPFPQRSRKLKTGRPIEVAKYNNKHNGSRGVNRQYCLFLPRQPKGQEVVAIAFVSDEHRSENQMLRRIPPRHDCLPV